LSTGNAVIHVSFANECRCRDSDDDAALFAGDLKCPAREDFTVLKNLE
jgi:hypothetical protein